MSTSIPIRKCEDCEHFREDKDFSQYETGRTMYARCAWDEALDTTDKKLRESAWLTGTGFYCSTMRSDNGKCTPRAVGFSPKNREYFIYTKRDMDNAKENGEREAKHSFRGGILMGGLTMGILIATAVFVWMMLERHA